MAWWCKASMAYLMDDDLRTNLMLSGETSMYVVDRHYVQSLPLPSSSLEFCYNIERLSNCIPCAFFCIQEGPERWPDKWPGETETSI